MKEQFSIEYNVFYSFTSVHFLEKAKKSWTNVMMATQTGIVIFTQHPFLTLLFLKNLKRKEKILFI